MVIYLYKEPSAAKISFHSTYKMELKQEIITEQKQFVQAKTSYFMTRRLFQQLDRCANWIQANGYLFIQTAFNSKNIIPFCILDGAQTGNHYWAEIICPGIDKLFYDKTFISAARPLCQLDTSQWLLLVPVAIGNEYWSYSVTWPTQ